MDRARTATAQDAPPAARQLEVISTAILGSRRARVRDRYAMA